MTIENKETITTTETVEKVQNVQEVEEEEYEELTEEQLKELNELNNDNSNNPFGERSSVPTTTTTDESSLVESMETLAMTNEKTTATYLIIDTNALISGTRLETLGKELWTIPEVLEEVRDKKTGDFLASFPFEIKTRQPTMESLLAVSEFSKKTGDYPSLSAVDMKLIALTYTFEAQVNGIENIKTEPEKLQVVTQKPVHHKKQHNNNKPKQQHPTEKKVKPTTTTTTTTPAPVKEQPVKEVTNDTTATTTTTTTTTTPKTDTDKPKKKRNRQKKPKTPKTDTADKNTTTTDTVTVTAVDTNTGCCDHKHDQPIVEKVEKVEVEVEVKEQSSVNNNQTSTTTTTQQPIVNKKKKSNNNKLMVNLEKIEQEVSKEKVVDPNEVLRLLKIKQAEEAEERKKNRVLKVEDEGEWINPENIKSKLSTTYLQEKIHYDVGCITRDFSMQNVILQMGLHLISADGIVIKQVKQFVLKCVACLNITMEMDKIFCGHCGNKALYKATTYVDRNGNQRVSVGSAKQFNLRGTIFSIPKPKGGKKNNDIILTEDQYLHKLRTTGQLYKKKVSKEINMNDLEMGFAHKGPSDDIVIGYGNKNPNVARKRIGKKNKSIAIF